MQLSTDNILAYTEAYTSPEDPVLTELQAFTRDHFLLPEMLSGHLQGRLLTFLSMLLRPARILEIGTYTGYSAICLARGLAENGRMITIEYNAELEQTIRTYFGKAGLSSAIELLTGDAVRILPGLAGPFDLDFIDADKKNYITYYDLCLPKLSERGILIADNVLWQGKVADPAVRDKETEAMRAFNDHVRALSDPQDPVSRGPGLPLLQGRI
jgi:caffeoyl-CoA O-methyltransferase